MQLTPNKLLLSFFYPGHLSSQIPLIQKKKKKIKLPPLSPHGFYPRLSPRAFYPRAPAMRRLVPAMKTYAPAMQGVTSAMKTHAPTMQRVAPTMKTLMQRVAPAMRTRAPAMRRVTVHLLEPQCSGS
ncbi:hypothetical protein AMTRI_Chr13g89500 [Amborella trichopoda]